MMRAPDWFYLFNTGQDDESYRRFGAHEVAPGRWQVTVWAPRAAGVAVAGDFSDWHDVALTLLPDLGIWQGAVEAHAGQRYQLRLTGQDGQVREKIDPFAFEFEAKPGTAAKLLDLPAHEWRDDAWLAAREKAHGQPAPLNIYEVHLGSFMRHPDGSYLTYQEAIKELLPYVKRMGYTHIELLPLMEHPLDASWGYQLMGYFAPTSRFGTPAEFLAFIDAAHQLGLGVIMDWVPSHFIKNADALAAFDGTPTFEYADPARAENRRWGTWNFDLAKTQVQSFLLSSAVFWLKHCHLDGLRVDAVSNMLYLDYDLGRENVRNALGGREDPAGIQFLQRLTTAVHQAVPSALIIAEESSAFPDVTRSTDTGGLGFDYKWNMGWLNDTLRYFSQDPQARRGQAQLLTFSFVYLFDEKFVLPFSHDEVVHGKRSLMHKMPGDRYNQFANLRVLFVWQMTHPGKKLLFMGSEWGPVFGMARLERTRVARPAGSAECAFSNVYAHAESVIPSHTSIMVAG